MILLGMPHIGSYIFDACSLASITTSQGLRRVALLEYACYWGWALGFPMLKSGPVSLFFLLSVKSDVEVSVPLARCLSVCHYAPCHALNGLNLQTYKLAPVLLYKSFCGHNGSP